MSAFVVDRHHIDALVSAGLALGEPHRRSGPVRWTAESEPPAGVWQEGEPWGPGYMDWITANRRELTDQTAGQVGAMLWAENRRSVNHRYAEEEWEEVYEYRPWGVHAPLDPVAMLGALSCYEYQACEHPEWADSEARRFCDALRGRLIGALPGYDDAPWEITAPHPTDAAIAARRG